MKNFILGIILITIGNVIYAQDFSGKAIYRTFTKVTVNPKLIKGMDSISRKKMEEKLSKRLQKTFTLNFSKSKSSYTQNKALVTETKKDDNVKIIGALGTDMFFKNISEKSYANKKELFGKRFLIEDSLPILPWEISHETKQIGNYTCYKATKIEEKERLTFIMVDGNNEPHTEKVKIVTTAWYTPEIPVSNGPEHYWGLPGLILEINEGKKTILCTELVLNPSKKTALEAPKKGEKVSQKEFDEILKRKEKEIMERFKTNNKGGGINIQTE